MAKLTFEISMSLDGYIAGPNPTLENPLGEDGERLHEWVVKLRELAGEPRPLRRRDRARQRPARAVDRLGGRQADGEADVQRRRGGVGGRSALRGVVGRRAAVRRPGLRPHAPRAGAPGDEGGHDLHFVTDGIEAALEQAEMRRGSATSRSPAAPASASSTCGRAGGRDDDPRRARCSSAAAPACSRTSATSRLRWRSTACSSLRPWPTSSTAFATRRRNRSWAKWWCRSSSRSTAWSRTPAAPRAGSAAAGPSSSTAGDEGTSSSSTR